MKRFLLPTALFLALGALLRAAPLQVGDAAPLVTGTAETGQPLDLGAVYKANKYTVVYFYTKAFTGGCTAQGCALRDSYDELTKKGVTIVGVSTDDVATQKSFKETNKFPFSLIADTDKTVVKAFGQSGLSMASREAYLIKDGKIIYKDTNVTGKQAENILNFLSRESAAPAADAKPAPAADKPAAPVAK
jgi:peroxiredoxin Q/BCP